MTGNVCVASNIYGQDGNQDKTWVVNVRSKSYYVNFSEVQKQKDTYMLFSQPVVWIVSFCLTKVTGYAKKNQICQCYIRRESLAEFLEPQLRDFFYTLV